MSSRHRGTVGIGVFLATLAVTLTVGGAQSADARPAAGATTAGAGKTSVAALHAERRFRDRAQ